MTAGGADVTAMRRIQGAAPELEFPAGTLGIVRDVFTALNTGGVRYCHWKSTTGLPVALAGGTDLDLLIDRGDAAQFTALVRDAGFKPFISHASRRYIGVEDWLGHDTASGRLVHLHVYYRLILGEDYVKNHVLPIERLVLDETAMLNGIRVPVPATELTILIIRALLKYRRTDAAKDALRLGRRGGIPPNLRAELADLDSRVTPDELRRAAHRLVPSMPPDIFTEFVEIVRSNPRDAFALLRLRGATRSALRPFERLPARTAAAISLGSRLQRAPVLRRLLRPRTKADLRRKSPAAGGLTVALIGPDGAGKTTVIDQVVTWLGWRLSLSVSYLGTARPSRPTAAAQSLSRVARRSANGLRPFVGPAAGLLAWAATIVTGLRYVAEASDRANRARAGRRLAMNGALVVFDRYPLDWVRLATRPVDGPRIAELGDASRRGLLARLRRREEAIYARIPAPDLVILLTIDPETALARKSSARPDGIAWKAKAVQDAAHTNSGEGVVAIDASQPLEDVVRAVEDEIWRRL